MDIHSYSRIGVLLLNLGTPNEPSVSAVRRYLREFLSDPRVIDLPAVARWLLLNLVILPLRPRQSAAAYRTIWSAAGSPLLANSQQLRAQLNDRLGEHYHVALGMRYGNPSIATALAELKQQHCTAMIVLPLFPQYSAAATGSALEKAMRVIAAQWNIAQITFASDFYVDPGFIDAQAHIIKEHWNDAQPEHIIFSYHGLPERHISKSGCLTEHCARTAPCPAITHANRYCYRAQCFATSKALAAALQLTPQQYSVAFQSRLGRTPWIKPYTDLLLPKLMQQGIKNIAVACPSFVADCLETLEEVGIRGRAQWQSLGGQRFTLIPCLNAHPAWVTAVANMIRDLSTKQ